VNPGAQLLHGVVLGPAAPRLMRARSWGRAAVYALLATIVLGAVSTLFATQETSLRRALESFLFPERVHKYVDFFLEYVVRSQTKQVVANAVVTFTMIFVSLLLFWAKERLSRAFEEDAGLGDAGRWRELGLFEEALEEVKLLLLNIAIFFFVLWLGHSPEPWRKTTATTLSYLALAFTWAVDFVSPYLMRRRMKYSQILSAIWRRPLLSLGFGAVMALPLVVIAHVAGRAEWPALTTVVVLFSANVVVIVWACMAGTWVAARLEDAAARVRPAPGWLHVPVWLVVLGVIGAGTWLGVHLARSLATKSQVLKCEYDVDWATLSVGKPSVGALLRGEVSASVSVDVTIKNPNRLPVVIEENRLVASDDDVVIAQTRLSPMSIPAGGERRERVTLDVTFEAKGVLSGASINPLAWDLVLYLEIADGFELPIYLRRGP